MKHKTIKIALSTCFLLFACILANPVFAQDKADMIKNSTPEQRAKMQTSMMKAKLQLDTVQVVKVQAINLTAAQKMDPLLKGDGGKLAKFRQMREIDNAKDKDLKNVLTPDQYKQYEAAKDEMKEKMKERLKDAKASKS
jgi:hypothetical protein